MRVQRSASGTLSPIEVIARCAGCAIGSWHRTVTLTLASHQSETCSALRALTCGFWRVRGASSAVSRATSCTVRTYLEVSRTWTFSIRELHFSVVALWAGGSKQKLSGTTFAFNIAGHAPEDSPILANFARSLKTVMVGWSSIGGPGIFTAKQPLFFDLWEVAKLIVRHSKATWWIALYEIIGDFPILHPSFELSNTFVVFALLG